MLAIDNAVELMIKTYLRLPARVTGLSISKREHEEIGESFPRLLDALAKHAGEKLEGIDLGQVEWYHRLRNQLYHDGNGLTVERSKVAVYSECARNLFKALFGFDLLEGGEEIHPPLAQLRPDRANQGGVTVHRRNKGWFFVPSLEGRRVFAAFANAKGSCSMRVFDAASGTALLSRPRYGAGDFQQHFRDIVRSAKPLHLSRQPSLERECRSGLPNEILQELKDQL